MSRVDGSAPVVLTPKEISMALGDNGHKLTIHPQAACGTEALNMKFLSLSQ